MLLGFVFVLIVLVMPEGIVPGLKRLLIPPGGDGK